jgi:hypothetical protein
MDKDREKEFLGMEQSLKKSSPGCKKIAPSE